MKTYRLAAPLACALACLAATACSPKLGGYRQMPSAPSLVEPGGNAEDTRATYLELIERMQAQGAYYASLAHIDAFRQRHGDSPALRLLQANALRQTGDLAAARPLYEGLLRSDQAAAAYHGLGLIAASGNDQAAAEAALLRATQLQPLNTSYLGDLGYARLRAGQLDAAQAPLAKALELAPDNARAAANLAVWALLRNDRASAERFLEQGKLPADSREQVLRQAAELRQRQRQRQATAAAAAAEAANQASRASRASATVSAPARTGTAALPNESRQTARAATASRSPAPRAVAADSATVRRTAAAHQSTSRTDPRDPHLPATMLERFGQATLATENTP